MPGPRVRHAVDAVAEAHHPHLVGQRLPDPRLGLRRRPDLLDHQHDLLVGAAVERALQGADGRDDRRVQVGQRGGGHARGERGGVELVVGVQDERDVEGLLLERVGFRAAQHVEEVGGERELRVRRHERLAPADPLPGGDERRHLRGEPQGLARRRLARVVGGVGVEGGERGHARAQHLHRRRLLRERAEDVEELRRQLAGGRERLQVGVHVLAARQPAVPEEVGDLLEGRVLDEVVDVEAAIDEPALAPVDETDVRRRDDDVLETALALAAHGASLAEVW